MQSIETRYVPATNHRGARIKATASNGESITLSYNECQETCQQSYSTTAEHWTHFVAVKAICNKLEWQGAVVCGDTMRGYVWVFRQYNGLNQQQWGV